MTHGLSNTNEFRIWTGMLTRCSNKNSTSFKNYGARGITVCAEWASSFESFFRDVGPRPSKAHSIERKDNALGYEPGNCFWATAKEQASNRRTNVTLVIDGESRTLGQWCEHFNTPYGTAWRRMQSGRQGRDIFTTPVKRLTYMGITDSIPGWSRRVGIKESTLAMRIHKYNWGVEVALTKGAQIALH
jgi:hypothetical protein